VSENQGACAMYVVCTAFPVGGAAMIRSWLDALLCYLFIMALQPFVAPWPLFQFRNLYTVVRTSWTVDQPARTLGSWARIPLEV
jgi:hypothetical protein